MYQKAILVDGYLFVKADRKAKRQGLGLTMGKTPVDLRPLEDDTQIPALHAAQRHFLIGESSPAFGERTPDGSETALGTEIRVNDLPDWTLDGGQTLQIRVGSPETPVKIHLHRTVIIQPGADRQKFRAHVAAHRSNASLVVQFSDPATQTEIGRESVSIAPGAHGGRLAESYQDVVVAIPQTDHPVEVSLAICHHSSRPDTEENYPYIFVANPRVGGAKERRSLLQPKSVSNGADSAAGQWFVARVPVIHSTADGALRITAGRSSSALFSPDDNDIRLVANDGHTVTVQAEKAVMTVLYIDGEPVQLQPVGTDPTTIRVPASHLRGVPATLSLRDLSGSQAFLTEPILPPRSLTPEDIMGRETRAPLPTELSPRAAHRFRGLRAHLDRPIEGIGIETLNTALDALDRGHEARTFAPLVFPQHANPDVSVIVPAHNQFAATYTCLASLLLAHNTASFEVIVVDDASTDRTAQLQDLVDGITVIRNEEAQRFIRACNAGVAASRGEYVVLLNNDTEVTVGWLDELIGAFARFDGVGAVGSKLLYPDGTLQDAGGIVWGSGNPWNYGNRANPWEPRFCYARQVDYLSGAALMSKRSIWDEVGGFSSELEPMYFEDTDFAFKIRDAGYKTYFVPSSIVYHFEGTTSGTDVKSGYKRFQEVNRPKFKRKWAKAYAGFGKEGQNPDLEKDRGIGGRVLFIDYATPREDRDAGSYAAWREIELVQSLGYKVTFLPQNLAYLGSYTTDLERAGVEVVCAPFVLSLSEFLEQRLSEFDAVYITRYYVAQETIDRIRQLAPDVKIILNNADLHFLRELRAALSSDDDARLDAMRSVRDQELEMMEKADLVLSYNEVEHSVIASHTEGRAKVMTCPWVVGIPDEVPPLKGRQGLSFLGSFRHHPNVEGITWFSETVMPGLDDTGLVLSIYGSGMGDDIRALHGDRIDPVGFVEDVADAFDRHRIFIAPLLSGAGIKGKVLSALAHGIPTVLTRIAAEGIGLRNGHDCLIAETPADWQAAIRVLSTDDAMWNAVSTAARSYVADRFSFETGRQQMRAAFEAVDLFGAR